jgi:hypothetical protein
MKRLFRTRLSRMTLLAFATSLFIVPVASAKPIDPGPSASPAHQTSVRPAKKQAAKWYRSSAAISNHGPVLP